MRKELAGKQHYFTSPLRASSAAISKMQHAERYSRWTSVWSVSIQRQTVPRTVSDRFPASVYLVLVRASSSSQFHSPSAKRTLVARYRPEPTTFVTELPAPIWASAAKNNISWRPDKGTARTHTRSASGPSIKANQVISPKSPRGGVRSTARFTSMPRCERLCCCIAISSRLTSSIIASTICF